MLCVLTDLAILLLAAVVGLTPSVRSTTVTVPPHRTQPSVSPVLVEDFSTYTSTANFFANPRGIWVPAEALNANHIVLDETVGYGTSKQSLRYDWPNNGSICGDYQLRPGFLKIPGRLTHVWVEFVVRFATNFTVDAGNGACAKEYKLASLGDYAMGIGRWNVAEMQARQFNVGAPGPDLTIDGSSPAPNSLWDGQPHVFRVEAALGPSGGGILRWWVDGHLRVNQIGFATALSHRVIDIFSPGMNINQGPAISGMHLWWHRIAVYANNPGW
jgi:hypothetical protein